VVLDSYKKKETKDISKASAELLIASNKVVK
jgi:hypothetical protein